MIITNEGERELPVVSIVVPAYEYGGNAAFYLGRLLDSIETQTFDDFEVVVSDHSFDDSVRNLCKSSGIPIRYVHNPQKRGNSSANMNLGIQESSGEILKVMHMDDFFCSNRALELMVQKLEEHPNAFWGVFGFTHFQQTSSSPSNSIVPSITTTLGCPSVSFLRRSRAGFDLFDENLIIINDHDFHQQLLLKYGPPLTIPEICVGIGVTSSQVSAGQGLERYDSEIEYFLHKRELVLRNLEREWTSNGQPKIQFQYVGEKGKSRQIRSSTLKKLGIRVAAQDAQQIVTRAAKLVRKALMKLSHRSKKAQFTFMDYVELGSRFSDTPRSLDDPLSRLANRFGSDKGTQIAKNVGHRTGPRLHFTPIYDLFLSPMRALPVKLLEIGIGSGASLPMWHGYFTNAEIFAVDIVRYAKPGLDRVTTSVLDQTDRKALEDFSDKHGPFDIIIDDGGHMMGQQQVSLGVLFGALKPGGFYFIEDLHTSYWPHGSYRDLYGTPLDINADRSNTTMHYLKNLLKDGVSNSQFMTVEENNRITQDLGKCLILNLPETEYGPNRLALLTKA